MSTAMTTDTADRPWAKEPSNRPGHKKIRARIGSLLLERPATPTADKPREARRPARQHGPWRWLRRALVALLSVAALAATLLFTVLRPPLVSVAEVKLGNVTAEVEVTGTVTADVLANIASKITGRVETVSVDEGDIVRKGQILAVLDQADLRHQVEKARAQLASATENAHELQIESNRRQILLAKGQLATTVEQAEQYARNYAVAQHAVEAAEADLGSAEYNLSLTEIPSLTSGIVTKRWVNLGDSVVPGETMFTVADTNLIYVSANIDQDLAGKVTKGQTATVVLRGREDQPLSGHVLRLNPQADAATEEAVAEVTFKIPPEQFQLGQWANVYVQVGTAKDALVVPRTALMPTEDKTYVFVVDANDKIRQEPVTVLASSPRTPTVAVTGHLSPGDRVVLMPTGLRTGETVRPTPVKEGQAAEPAQ